MHNSELLLRGLVICAGLALALAALAIHVGLIRLPSAAPQFFESLLAGILETPPVCSHCGRRAEFLGTTANSRWFYCPPSGTPPGCGHYWREEPLANDAPVTSGSAA